MITTMISMLIVAASVAVSPGEGTAAKTDVKTIVTEASHRESCKEEGSSEDCEKKINESVKDEKNTGEPKTL